eukprot:c5132_g2_i1 orf=413-619(+)
MKQKGHTVAWTNSNMQSSSMLSLNRVCMWQWQLHCNGTDIILTLSYKFNFIRNLKYNRPLAAPGTWTI